MTAPSVHSFLHRLFAPVLLAGLACVHGCTCAPPPAAAPLALPPHLLDISGLAPLGDHHYIAVRDAKTEAAPGPVIDRLATISIDASGKVACSPIALDVAAADLPMDLESVARVPGSADRVLLLESGGNNGPRRLYTCVVTPTTPTTPTGVPGGKYAAALACPPLDLRPHTQSLSNIESLIARAPSDSPGDLVLIVADRADHDGAIAFVSIMLRDGAVVESRQWAAPAPSMEPLRISAKAGTKDASAAADDHRSLRICSDLLLASDGRLYMSSCADGGTGGPHSSMVSLLGRFDGVRIVPGPDTPSVGIPTHKVEALAAFVLPTGECRLLVGSDDESAGGFLQVILPPGSASSARSSRP